MSLPISFTKLATLAASGSSVGIPLGQATEAEVTLYVGANATWGGGTLTLTQSFDGGTTWLTVPNVSATAGVANQVLGRYTVIGGGQIRATLAGATTPSLDIAVKVEQVKNRPVLNYTLTANGSTPSFVISEETPAMPVTNLSTPANVLMWAAQGTWGSGTLVFEVSPDGGTTWYKQLAGITANGLGYSQGLSDVLGRFTLSGATTPSLSLFVLA